MASLGAKTAWEVFAGADSTPSLALAVLVRNPGAGESTGVLTGSELVPIQARAFLWVHADRS